MEPYGRRMTMVRQSRFAEMFLVWLAEAAGEFWSGTATDLQRALWEFRESRREFRHTVDLYRGRGLPTQLAVMATKIGAAGWSVAFRRTSDARTIEITRKGAKR